MMNIEEPSRSRGDEEETLFDTPGLGACCICLDTGAHVRNIMILPWRCAVAGHGHGCAVCGLAADGCSAVLCDVCMERYRADRTILKWVCRGWPAGDGREPIESARARGFFHHHLQRHTELDDETRRRMLEDQAEQVGVEDAACAGESDSGVTAGRDPFLKETR